MLRQATVSTTEHGPQCARDHIRQDQRSPVPELCPSPGMSTEDGHTEDPACFLEGPVGGVRERGWPFRKVHFRLLLGGEGWPALP